MILYFVFNMSNFNLKILFSKIKYWHIFSQLLQIHFTLTQHSNSWQRKSLPYYKNIWKHPSLFARLQDAGLLYNWLHQIYSCSDYNAHQFSCNVKNPEWRFSLYSKHAYACDLQRMGISFFIIRNKLIGYIPSCIEESLKISHLLLLAIWMFQ